MKEQTEHVRHLLQVHPSKNQKKLATILGLAILLIAAAVLPFSTYQLPEIKAFLPGFIAWYMFGDFLTAFMLFGQYNASRSRPVLALSCTFLFTGLVMIPHILTFPGVFSETGLIGAGTQSAIWLWVCWHGGFPLGIGVYLAMGRMKRQLVPPRQVIPLGLLAVSITLAGAVAFYLLATLWNDWLPQIIQKGNYKILLTSGVGPVVWFINLLVLLMSFRRRRLNNVLNLWLAIAMLASLMDVTVTLFAGARYSIGWYTARLLSLAAASVVIASLVYEVTQLYMQIVGQHTQLSASQKQLELANVKLTRLSNLDGLTGIPNRRKFDACLTENFQQLAAEGKPLSLLLLDIDCFKAYNDFYGHLSGDHVLKNVAAAIDRELAGLEGLAARYGGEEFAVILPGLSPANAKQIGEQIRSAVEALGIPHERSSASKVITVSVGGFTAIPDLAMQQQEMIALADQSLYLAKETGRNRVNMKDTSFHPHVFQDQL